MDLLEVAFTTGLEKGPPVLKRMPLSADYNLNRRCTTVGPVRFWDNVPAAKTAICLDIGRSRGGRVAIAPPVTIKGRKGTNAQQSVPPALFRQIDKD
ncbi:MAG: hypothetical protein WD845_11925 [Pirellulales bacterium]